MNVAIDRKKISAFSPSCLSMTDVLIDNLLSTRTGGIAVKDNSASFSFKTKSMVNQECDYKHYVSAIIWGKPVLILLPRFPFPEALNKITSDEELSTIPKALSLITLSIVYEDFIAELSDVLSTPVTLTTYFTSKNPLEKSERYNHRVYFSLLDGLDDNVEGCLLFGNDILQNILHYINKTPSVPLLQLRDINTSVFFEAGGVSLTQNELSLLETGDIMMIDSDQKKKDESQLAIRLLTGHKFLGELNGSLSYRILEAVIMEDETNTNNEDENVSLDEIPLAISFDLGSVPISLEEVKKLGVGYTLELQKEFTDLVTIRINNKVIGKGELVDVGNRAGVRLTHLKCQ